MISKGKKIDTNFSLQVVKNGEHKEVPFSELLDRPAIISVYMKNNTSSCDKQTESLAEESEWFSKKGYNLIAISKDGYRSHQNYAKKKGINYILASDPEYKFAEATDSIIEKNMFGNTFEAPSRSAYIIDTDGTVLEIIEKVNTKAHAEELKELVESLQN
jgi:peroxiredoxin Q/BCP